MRLEDEIRLPADDDDIEIVAVRNSQGEDVHLDVLLEQWRGQLKLRSTVKQPTVDILTRTPAAHLRHRHLDLQESKRTIAFLIAQETAKNPSALLTSKIKEFQPNPRRLQHHYRTSSHTLPAPSSRTRKPGASSSSVVLWRIHGRVLFTKPPFHPMSQKIARHDFCIPQRVDH